MGQSSIIMALAVAFILTVVILNTDDKVNETTQKSVDYYAKNVAQNICNSATEMLLTEVAENKDFRVSNSKEMMGGTVNYKLIDTTINGEQKFKITVQAVYNGETAENILVASPLIEGFVPPGLKGAITTNNETNVSGNMLVDGRDFDLNGKRIKGQGIYGVWTTNTFTKNNGSLIGGFANNKDYPPTKNLNQNIIKQNQSWPLGYSHTPDGVMGGYDYGFSEGTLKSLAISGKEGGQYVTNPSNLKFPIAGVTYVELASGSKWSPNLSGSGILIVHNSNRNAFLDNIQGNFQGLIISDHVDQFHANLLGGLIGLASDNTFGPAISLGSGEIKYSSEAIKLVTKNIGKGRIVGGKYRLAIDYWLEN